MTKDQEPTNVLVVDDLPEKLLVYRTILDGLGLNLVTAGSGEEALRAVLASDFAVILLDVNMPGMSGLEAAGLIRKRKRSAHTPIIFLTAFADEVRATEGYEQGAVDYISTPVVPAILRAKIKVFADLYRMTQQVRRQAEERIALAEERSRREAAEEANRRLAFLTHAGAVLGGTLDPDQAARDTLRLALTYLADMAVLVTSPTERRGWLALRARTAAGAVAFDADVGRDAIEPTLTAAADRAFASGATVGGDLVLAVPLRARGQVLAVLGLSRQATGRPFPPADVPVAETLASRAAMALDNARLYRELQTADRQKNEFLSMLAHELRNPLAPIRSATEVLSHSGPDPARARWAHGVIDRQVTQLVRLVDDLLDVSRITLGKIRLASEVVELAAAVAQAVEAVRPLIDKCGHRLSVGELPPAYVRGDPTRLIQVFANLLNNAAKYTDPGGSVALTAALVGTDRVEVRVRDTGVGISEDLLPTVFDLFTQASRSLDRSQGGLGVGLTLVRRLVEMHGGQVSAFSDGPGRGSEFVVALPLTADRPADRATAATAPARHALRVMVIDDNVDAAETLADLVAMLGHEARVAHDGPAGIAAATEFRPDVVLLDIGLPGMDGYEVARRLRADAAGAVLVAVSGYGREEDRAAARAAGFAHHFVKPIDFGTLQTVFAAAGSAAG